MLCRERHALGRAGGGIGLPHDHIILSAKVSGVQDLVAVYRMLGERSDYPLHLGLTEAGMGTKGVVASTAGLSILLQEGIGDTIRVSLTRAPAAIDRGSAGGATGAPITRHSQLHTTGHRMSGCVAQPRRFQEMAEQIQTYLRDQRPAWQARYPGSRSCVSR